MQTKDGQQLESQSYSGRKFKAFVFDLDGTLLNTLPDLVSLTNSVLEEEGYPTHTTEEIMSYVGNGVRALMVQAVPQGIDDALVSKALNRWKELYPKYGYAKTKPYDGIPETIAALKDANIARGVLSNKFDAAAREVVARYFSDSFDIVRGESPEFPRKPDPTGLLKMIDYLGVEPCEVAYIGDSGGDMDVAVRAGVFAIGVSWGYQPVSLLWEKGADVIVDSPCELLNWA